MLPAFLIAGQLLAFSAKGLLLWWFAVLGCAVGAFGTGMTIFTALLWWAEARQDELRRRRFREDGRAR